MMRATSLVCLSLAALALQGCLARAAVDVVTLPVKVASAGGTLGRVNPVNGFIYN
jgi:hypothetical protein